MKQILLLSLLAAAAWGAIVAPTKPGCVVKKADIAFIVDASGSVSITDWSKSLEFVAKMVEGFDIGPNSVQVALMQFSSSSSIEFDFKKHRTAVSLVNAIRTTPKNSGGTSTFLALEMAKQSLFTPARGMRAGVPHLVFVMTDGASSNAAQTAAKAKVLHNNGFTVFAVGIGNAKSSELTAIASNPKYVYTYQDYSKLSQIQATFAKSTCEVAVKLATTVPPPPTTKKDCIVKKADIVFVVDGSGSVGTTEWDQSLNFITKVVQGFNIGSNGVKVALIEFSANAAVQFGFNSHTDQASLQAAIKKARKTNGGTVTSKALDLARTSLFTPKGGMRPGVPQLLFIITDGKSNDQTTTINSARLLHKQGVTVFAIGVKGARQSELQGMASANNYVYSYTDFSKLAKLQETFSRNICKDVQKLASSTPIPVPTKPRPLQGCATNYADIVFAVDSSSSVGEDNFNLTRSFLNLMMEAFDFTKIRVGMLKFNDKVFEEFELNQNNDLRKAQTAISSMSYDVGAGTVISGAIKHMRMKSFKPQNGDRPNIPNIAVVVTDGQAKDPYRTQYEANLTKAEGIQIFTIGVGDQIKDSELRNLASSPNFVFLVNNYLRLNSIRDSFALQLCQGFTLPPATTLAPCTCKDAEDNCANYGTNICVESRYRKWAKETCPLFCDLCDPRCTKEIKPPKPCKDSIPDCKSKINVCTEPAYHQYALDTCPQYCNLCSELNPTRFTQPPTTPTTTTTTTTTKPTTVTTTPTTTTGPPKPTPPCDPNCYDKDSKCDGYGGKSQCSEKRYQAFFQNNCPLYCGFCTPIAKCKPTAAPCSDMQDCSGYSNTDCINFPDWARKNCRKRCQMCPGDAPLTVPITPAGCSDLEDCSVYGKDVCTDYKDFASTNCRAYCGLCKSNVVTTRPACVDRRDCTIYEKAFCTNPDYRRFMLTECRLFCNLCNADV